MFCEKYNKISISIKQYFLRTIHLLTHNKRRN